MDVLKILETYGSAATVANKMKSMLKGTYNYDEDQNIAVLSVVVALNYTEGLRKFYQSTVDNPQCAAACLEVNVDDTFPNRLAIECDDIWGSKCSQVCLKILDT